MASWSLTRASSERLIKQLGMDFTIFVIVGPSTISPPKEWRLGVGNSLADDDTATDLRLHSLGNGKLDMGEPVLVLGGSWSMARQSELPLETHRHQRPELFTFPSSIWWFILLKPNQNRFFTILNYKISSINRNRIKRKCQDRGGAEERNSHSPSNSLADTKSLYPTQRKRASL